MSDKMQAASAKRPTFPITGPAEMEDLPDGIYQLWDMGENEAHCVVEKRGDAFYWFGEREPWSADQLAFGNPDAGFGIAGPLVLQAEAEAQRDRAVELLREAYRCLYEKKEAGIDFIKGMSEFLAEQETNDE